VTPMRILMTRSRYCDGTSYTSDRAEPVTVGGGQIYYRGWRILNALIDDWLEQGMAEAGAVILSGTSAGGLTTYQHAEYHRPCDIVRIMIGEAIWIG
jgi:hypothetical protein